MKKKFFPLWFINVISTEEKLMKLSANGLHLSDMSYGSGIFTFENGENENGPEFYSDGEMRLKHAGRMALTFGGPYVFCAAFMIYFLVMFFSNINDPGIDRIFIVFLPLIICLALAELGYFAFKTIGFYIRTKRKYDNKN